MGLIIYGRKKTNKMKTENLIIFRDKKKFILYLLLIIISLLMLNLTIYVTKYISYYIDSVIGNKKVNRIYSVTVNENNKDNIEKILKNNNKLNYYYASYNLPNAFYKETLLEIKNIKSINSDDIQNNLIEDKENIIVTNFFSENNDLQINDNINILINQQPYDFKIIDSIYSKNIRDIYLTDDMIELIASDCGLEITEYIFEITDIKYINDLKKEFSDINAKVQLTNETGLKELQSYESMKKFMTYITIIICFSLFILLYCIIKDIYYNERKNIAIKKLIGYNNIKCILDIMYKVFVYIICGILCSSIIILIIKTIIRLTNNNIIIKNFLNNNKLWSLSILSYIIFIIIYLISLISNIKKIIKLNPIIELNKE